MGPGGRREAVADEKGFTRWRRGKRRRVDWLVLALTPISISIHSHYSLASHSTSQQPLSHSAAVNSSGGGVGVGLLSEWGRRVEIKVLSTGMRAYDIQR